jgi:tetratricopeptide (TPR) repeat protein
MGYSPLVRALHHGAEAIAMAGQLDRARDRTRRALQLARDRSETFTVSWAISLLARLADFAGGTVLDPNLQAEARALADDPGDLVVRVLALETLGHTALVAGDPKRAKDLLRRAIAQGRDDGLRLNEARMLALLARTELGLHESDAALGAADEAVRLCRRQGSRVLECLALLTRAGVRRAAGDRPDIVLGDLDAGLILAAETRALTMEPFLREERGRITGDETELRQAVRLYRRIGAPGQARRLEAEPGFSGAAGG